MIMMMTMTMAQPWVCGTSDRVVSTTVQQGGLVECKGQLACITCWWIFVIVTNHEAALRAAPLCRPVKGPNFTQPNFGLFFNWLHYIYPRQGWWASAHDCSSGVSQRKLFTCVLRFLDAACFCLSVLWLHTHKSTLNYFYGLYTGHNEKDFLSSNCGSWYPA